MVIDLDSLPASQTTLHALHSVAQNVKHGVVIDPDYSLLHRLCMWECRELESVVHTAYSGRAGLEPHYGCVWRHGEI